MVDNKETELTANEARHQLVWKGALLLVCLALFALVMRSGARENAHAERCATADQAARAACIASLRTLASQPPAKGGLRPVSPAEPHPN